MYEMGTNFRKEILDRTYSKADKHYLFLQKQEKGFGANVSQNVENVKSSVLEKVVNFGFLSRTSQIIG
jgi:hypothetical protein